MSETEIGDEVQITVRQNPSAAFTGSFGPTSAVMIWRQRQHTQPTGSPVKWLPSFRQPGSTLSLSELYIQTAARDRDSSEAKRTKLIRSAPVVCCKHTLPEPLLAGGCIIVGTPIEGPLSRLTLLGPGSVTYWTIFPEPKSGTRTTCQQCSIMPQ